ncbi:hypothetical protein CI102_13856 [Trichoderma harzianum]|nr:hypothetical protein CI102_13856 [Trichoderma harzianum]
MPSSSTQAVQNCNNEDKEPQSIEHNLDRFLGQNGHGDHERPPIAFMRPRDTATAEAEETAAMRARLDAFDRQFHTSANQSANHSHS